MTYPQGEIPGPFIVIQQNDRTATLTDHDGAEIIVRMGWAVDFYGDSPSQCREMMGDFTDRVAEYNIHTIGYMQQWDENNLLYCLTASYYTMIDRRGDTFTG